ncbi:MAG: cytochrome c oxidase subunit II, partial [Halobacteriales archaeon]|nr:cytochrome c oxidase subunit II [Halobacteriales archaeon]
MWIALLLVLIAVGSVVFTYVSPWTFTPLASNWWTIDLTTNITFVVTGIAFVAITLFMAYVIVRYRHRKGHQAEYMPEEPRLEKRLIAVTTLGIVVLLAPGMFVYNELISAPADAMKLEVLGEQWRWTYRFAGQDGEFGETSPELIGPTNPYGIDPDDPAGTDDVLVQAGTVHLPIDVPIHLEIRSKDVLHSFYVPEFRVKMDAVPGMVTETWFTPTRTGTYDLVCAEYCGL